jgi:hypothetical protein
VITAIAPRKDGDDYQEVRQQRGFCYLGDDRSHGCVLGGGRPTFRSRDRPCKDAQFSRPAHHVTGQVLSVNKPAKLFTLKTADGATMLLAADGACFLSSAP